MIPSLSTLIAIVHYWLGWQVLDYARGVYSRRRTRMAAINKPQPSNPPNSGDVEARKLLGAHVGSGIKSTPARTSAGSTRTKAAQTTGTKQGGGGRVSGGRG